MPKSFVYIYEPLVLGKSPWFRNMRLILENSLSDIGHRISTTPLFADIVIAIQHFPSDMKKEVGKKYILYQTEAYADKPKAIENYYSFGPDEIWGFDNKNQREKYTPLGYHPCMCFPFDYKQDWEVSFMGGITKRRKEFFQKVKYPPHHWGSFNAIEKCKQIKRTKINLHINSRLNPDVNGFTCWERISHFLANDSFFIAEKAYYPIEDIPQFDSIESYDALVEFYLSRPEERKERALGLSKQYRTDFDMRDILRERL